MESTSLASLNFSRPGMCTRLFVTVHQGSTRVHGNRSNANGNGNSSLRFRCSRSAQPSDDGMSFRLCTYDRICISGASLQLSCLPGCPGTFTWFYMTTTCYVTRHNCICRGADDGSQPLTSAEPLLLTAQGLIVLPPHTVQFSVRLSSQVACRGLSLWSNGTSYNSEPARLPSPLFALESLLHVSATNHGTPDSLKFDALLLLHLFFMVCNIPL